MESLPAEHDFYFLNDAAIDEMLVEFAKTYTEQIPPLFSAKKMDGKRLYAIAREGKSVERKPHPVHIFQIRCLKVDREITSGSILQIVIEVECSGGTYIRTLAEDFARYSLQNSTRTNFESINNKKTAPAHLTRLIRSKVKTILADDLNLSPTHSLWVPLSKIVRKAFADDESFVEFFVDKNTELSLRQGKIKYFKPDIHALRKVDSNYPEWAGAYCAHSQDLIALYQYNNGDWLFMRGFS